MQKGEQDNKSTMQIEVNKTNIKWLIEQAKEIRKDLDSINSRLLGILVAMMLSAFGFIGTLLVTFLNLG